MGYLPRCIGVLPMNSHGQDGHATSPGQSPCRIHVDSVDSWRLTFAER